MPNYEVNAAGVKKARQLIDDGKVDSETPWSEGAPSAGEENQEIDHHDRAEYGEWHLAIDKDAGEATKARYRFPYGDFEQVSRAGLIHAKQRAAQNDHKDIADAADELLERIDAGRK